MTLASDHPRRALLCKGEGAFASRRRIVVVPNSVVRLGSR